MTPSGWCCARSASSALRIRATLASRRALRLRDRSSPSTASRFHWWRTSTPPQWPRINSSQRSGRCSRGGVLGVAAFAAGLPGLLERPRAAHHDQAARKGEVRRQRFNGEGLDGTFFDAPMTGCGLDKKGGGANASKACACLKSLGGLPLIWSR